MEPTYAKVREYVELINPELDSEDLLDFAIADVVDRAVAYMGREFLIPTDEETEPEQPALPVVLERALASVVVGAYKNIDSVNDGGREIAKVKDGVQEVTYSDNIASYLSGVSDNEIFAQVRTLMDKFRLARVPTIYEDTSEF